MNPSNQATLEPKDLETLDKFEDWLRSYPPTAVVGAAATACSCPLANWGEALLGAPTFVEEGALYTHSRDRNVCFDLTEICQRFAEKIDAFFDDEITAREAIEILQECRSELDIMPIGGWG
jgi:hypothetical protein